MPNRDFFSNPSINNINNPNYQVRVKNAIYTPVFSNNDEPGTLIKKAVSYVGTSTVNTTTTAVFFTDTSSSGSGSQGLQGPQGSVGTSGSSGQNGAQGLRGFQGLLGGNGQDGSQGFQGYQGLIGQGSQGPQGVFGADGVGFQGPQGVIGQLGPQGPFNSPINIIYSDLVTAISNSTLIPGGLYRITDFQTVHVIPNTSPPVTNTGPIEPLLVTAISNNRISEIAYSETYPMDVITYTTNNAMGPSGALKGVILRRHDKLVNVDVVGDWRNTKYRRWKANPNQWDSGTAYTYWQTVQYTDGAIYYVNNPNGVVAGTIPNNASDDWVMVLPNNNYYYCRLSTTMTFDQLGVGIATPPPVVPANAADFIDVPMFQDYDSINNPSLYYNLKIDFGWSVLINLVFFRNVARTSVIHDTVIGMYSASTQMSSTLVADGNNFYNSTYTNGFINSVIVSTGGVGGINIRKYVYNCFWWGTIFSVDANEIIYTIMRGQVKGLIAGYIKYAQLPNLVYDCTFNSVMGAIKFSSNATLQNTQFLMNAGNQYSASFGQQNALTPIPCNIPLVGKTFIGGISQTGNGGAQSLILQSAFDRAAYRKIIYIGEDQPSEKTIISITDGSPLTVNWQTDLTPFSANNTYISSDDSVSIINYFQRHGNDFVITQKDLVSGSWVVNYTPTYTITVDGSNNVSQVVFTPTGGSTESRFIII